MTALSEPVSTEAQDENPIIGTSLLMVRAIGLARRFAPTRMPLLLVGATGTGKELFARAAHRWSRRPGPFVDLNCAALPREMIEALLFGHRRGAFTGAVESLAGLVEHADGGTLFLDELGSLALEAQGKLLRVLETHEVRRIGDGSSRLVSLRIIAAAQPGLRAEVAAGRIRLDLYHRLAGVVIELPPLNARGADLDLLAHDFLAAQGRRLDPAALPSLRSHPWPGNVRELRTVLERAIWFAEGVEIGPAAIADALRLGGICGEEPAPVPPADGTRELRELCEANRWKADAIATALGVRRTKMYAVLKSAGISLRQARQHWPGA